MHREQRGGRMNEAEKERLIKKDIASIENRVRHAFNQGYEMGAKVSRSENPNTCEDAISRQAVLDAIMANCVWENEYNLTASRIKKAVESLPSVTSKPKTGRWIAVENEEMDTISYYCSKCDLPMETENQTEFCPHCGMQMEVKE